MSNIKRQAKFEFGGIEDEQYKYAKPRQKGK